MELEPIQKFTETAKKACLCTTLSIFLILIFIISPLNKISIMSILGKIIVVILLIVSIFMITTNTYQFTKRYDISILDITFWKNQMNINVMCNYTFSLFLIILLLCVIKKIFTVTL